MTLGSELHLVDPAVLALHEVAEPGRLRALIRQLRASEVQDAPVLVTEERHGLLVLDGVHRTQALLSLGVPRMLAVRVPRREVADPDAWTHRVRHGEVEERVLAALRSARQVSLEPGRGTGGGRIVAHLVTAGDSAVAVTRGSGAEALARAYHAVADSYQDLPYQRIGVPEQPAPGELQVRWVAPSLAEIEGLVAAHGALPAGITRFGVPPMPGRWRATFGELSAATRPDSARELLASLTRHGV